jgi:hypothetical protein
MKFSKLDFKPLIQVTLTWTFINFAANLLGLWITKLLNEAAYEYPENVFNEFAKPILIQSFLFGICFAIGLMFLKKKNLAHYTFVALQLVVFHLIFILNLKINHGLHFVSSFENIGLKYLSYFGQYLIDTLYLYFPINGNFQHGVFAPDNLATFYIHWIFLNIAYYAAITWLSIKTAKYFLGTKTTFEIGNNEAAQKEEDSL